MDDRKLEDMLSHLKAPEPSKDAQKQALERAMAAFDEKMSKTTQANPETKRLTGIENILSHVRRKLMQKRFVISGTTGAVATCALIAVLGTPFFYSQVSQLVVDDAAVEPVATPGNSQLVDMTKNVITASPSFCLFNCDKGDAGQAEIQSMRMEGGADLFADSASAPKKSDDIHGRLEARKVPSAERAEPQGLAAMPMGAGNAAGATMQVAPMMSMDAAAPKAKEESKVMREIAPMSERVARKPSAPLTPAPASNVMPGFVAPTEADMAVVSPVQPPVDIIQHQYQDVGRDQFQAFEENSVKAVQAEPVSTFSIDVDTSSYSFVRRALNSGVMPQKNAIRIEEMVNYFDYNYALPEEGGDPFLPTVAVYDSPWRSGNKLIHIGVKGYEVQTKPKSNLVFLLDTSGSMHSQDKLPLLVNSFKMLLDTLSADDTVSIVTYAGSSGVALAPTKAGDKQKIFSVLDNLQASGSTAGAEGIRQAYQLAEQNFVKDGNNRIILATDGDFNVGITNQDELKGFVERKRKEGIFLSVLGFGQGNYNDHMMQTLAQNGNGTAAYIDSLNEARKVLVDEASSMLFTIAKDVKLQVEFNPQTVQEYRLVGYETRALNREDFNNDKVDAGDIGAGHTVTAIYEITPVGAPPLVDDLRYQKPAAKAEPKPEADLVKTAEGGEEYAFLKIRYKKPDSDTSTLMTRPITKADEKPFASLSDDIRFANAVASFAQMLKGSKFVPADYDAVIETANQARGKDEFGYRTEFVNLVRLAKTAAGLQPLR